VIIDSKGEIIGHGISRCEAKDMLALSKGIAVRTRGGIKQ
jgi:archaeosine-15-forming tRNA-guanine transglycosylase